MTIVALADRIDAILILKGMNLKQFHKVTGVPYINLHKYHNGKTKRMGPEVAEKILCAFPDLSDLYVYAGKGPMQNHEKESVAMWEKKIKHMEKELARANKELEMVHELISLKDEVSILRNGTGKPIKPSHANGK